ncbi:Chloroperoxidase [Amylocarpus encephaloides]|uniref:Chloroperoxidase n=1 Tax=Amylocarpus encephaloides TaxID=45428 RepID=A0A9P7YGW7_9HELO|nr:Chloroperoxidase [Amylocarpus encephaloides]
MFGKQLVKMMAARLPYLFVVSLANHGILPRHGLNIPMADLIVAFNTSINLGPEATQQVGDEALSACDGTTFNLDDRHKHGTPEHDASLSRWDTYFGDNHSLSATI